MTQKLKKVKANKALNSQKVKANSVQPGGESATANAREEGHWRQLSASRAA